MVVLGLIERNDYPVRVKILRVWAVATPVITASAYFYFQNPVWMLTIGQLLKAIKYPLMAGGTIYLRYRHLDPRIQPGGKADLLLWACFGIMIALATWILYVKFIA